MASNTYLQGQTIKLRCTFLPADDPTGAPIDPPSVTATVRAPSGALATYRYGVDANVSREGAGRYAAEIVADEGGVWWYKFAGASPVAGVGERAFNVQRSHA